MNVENNELLELWERLSAGWTESEQKVARTLIAAHVLFLSELIAAAEKKAR